MMGEVVKTKINKAFGLRVHDDGFTLAFPPGDLFLNIKVFAHIRTACAKIITEHFRSIFVGHLYGRHAVLKIIHPVFPVMAVTTTMVEPGHGVAFGFFAGVDGGTVALIIAGGLKELGGGILGEIVGQTLPVEAGHEAVMADPEAMPGDGTEVRNEFRH